MACRDGLARSVQLGVQQLCLETDCQEFVQLWRAGDNQRSRVATIIKEMKEMSSGLHNFTISFVPRYCNEVAYILAKQVKGDTRRLVVPNSGVSRPF